MQQYRAKGRKNLNGIWGTSDFSWKRQRSGEKSTDGDCTVDTYSCSDFDSYQEALRVLNACPGDPHNLDDNGDGKPCESLQD